METPQLMSVNEVAQRLVDLCRKVAYKQAHEELYAANARSIEPEGVKDAHVEGIDAIMKKDEQFQANVKEMHSTTVSDAIVAGSYFTLLLEIDMTMQNDRRMKMAEICVYKVEEGKIVSEQFFY